MSEALKPIVGDVYRDNAGRELTVLYVGEESTFVRSQYSQEYSMTFQCLSNMVRIHPESLPQGVERTGVNREIVFTDSYGDKIFFYGDPDIGHIYIRTEVTTEADTEIAIPVSTFRWISDDIQKGDCNGEAS